MRNIKNANYWMCIFRCFSFLSIFFAICDLLAGINAISTCKTYLHKWTSDVCLINQSETIFAGFFSTNLLTLSISIMWFSSPERITFISSTFGFALYLSRCLSVCPSLSHSIVYMIINLMDMKEQNLKPNIYFHVFVRLCNKLCIAMIKCTLWYTGA